eukprot:441953_1
MTEKNSVVRREIRSLTKDEFDRFVNAVNTMMKNKNGSGTSEYFRLASYHGEPGDYCHHNKESFPGWHRIYIYKFEQALQSADIENGNDGNIFLPYWDWTTNTSDKLSTDILRGEFTEFPSDFWPENFWDSYPNTNPEFEKRPVRASDELVTQFIEDERYGVLTEARDCVLNAEHWKHATKSYMEFSDYASIESPHDSIHGIVGVTGGQMGSVAWAAYDIVFWLHHSNVDRQYEGYLKLEPDSQEEFKAFQETGKYEIDIGETEGFEWLKNLEANQQKDINHYEAPLEPFKKEDMDKDKNEYYHIENTFNTSELKYVFDELPPVPTQDDVSNLLSAPPTLAVFPNVKLSDFDSKCYMIYLFVYDKEEKEEKDM